MTQLINDILTISKLETEEMQVTYSHIQVKKLLDSIIETLRVQIEKMDLKIYVNATEFTVFASMDHIKGIFYNVISNAIKYNKPGGWVHVTLNADHQYFYLKVEDSGIGIPEDSLEHIYERFYRVDKSHSREIGGTGLGLAITRNAVLMHRGAIKVFSTEGEGTIFNVRIPLNYIA